METVGLTILLQIFIVGAGIEIIRRMVRNSNFMDKNVHEKLCGERMRFLEEKICGKTDVMSQLIKSINEKLETFEKRLDNIEKILIRGLKNGQ